MESLTPDQDELAERQPAKAERKSGKSGGGGDNKTGSGGGGSRPPRGGSGSRVTWLLLILIMVMAGTGGWMFWEQQRVLTEMAVELDEASHWVRESRLARARLEGQLKEADQQLAKTDGEVGEQLAFLDSEMRKLWVISRERNRPAIAENKEALSALRETVAETEGQFESIRAAQAEQQERLAALAASQTSDDEKVADLAEAIKREGSAREEGQEALESRIERLSRDRGLAMDELAARLDRVEREVEAGSAAAGVEQDLAALEQQLNELQEVVDSIDSARAQLTRRYTDLGERVDRLARRVDNGN